MFNSYQFRNEQQEDISEKDKQLKNFFKKDTPEDYLKMGQNYQNFSDSHILSMLLPYLICTQKNFDDVKKLLLKEDVFYDDNLSNKYMRYSFYNVHRTVSFCISDKVMRNNYYSNKLFHCYDPSILVDGCDRDYQHLLFNFVAHKVNMQIIINEKKREDLINEIVRKLFIKDLSDIIFGYLPPMEL